MLGDTRNTKMATEEEFERIELSIEQAKYSIDNMKALNRLTKNDDFKHLFLEGYFKEEASRLVLLKAEPRAEKDEFQKSIMLAIDAIGHMRQYCHTIQQTGRMAEKALQDNENEREEMLAEA